MWVDTFTIRVGAKLAGLGADEPALAARLRTFLAVHVVDDPAPLALGLSLGTGTASPDRGPRPVPALRFGGRVLSRSRHIDDLFVDLAGFLGSLAAITDDDPEGGAADRGGVPITALRVFGRDGLAVLTDMARPALSGDRRLAAAGIRELAAFRVRLDGPDAVRVPPMLPGCAWSTVGLAADPRPEWLRLVVVDVLHEVRGDAPVSMAATATALVPAVGGSGRLRWLAGFAERDRLAPCRDAHAVTDRIVRRLNA